MGRTSVDSRVDRERCDGSHLGGHEPETRWRFCDWKRARAKGAPKSADHIAPLATEIAALFTEMSVG